MMCCFDDGMNDEHYDGRNERKKSAQRELVTRQHPSIHPSNTVSFFSLSSFALFLHFFRGGVMCQLLHPRAEKESTRESIVYNFE